MNYSRKQPCNNCPYRKDAPLRHWAKEEFDRLLETEEEQLGGLFGCYKKDDHVCVGWLIDQDNRNLPSIVLRISLNKNNVTREYLDQLHCKTVMYKSIRTMIRANYPELTF